jgi:diguanylate cyclase (GGDEF)-like protein
VREGPRRKASYGASAASATDGAVLSSSTMLNVLGALLLVSGVVSLPATLLDHTPGAHHSLILALICAIPLTAAFVFIRARRAGPKVSEWSIHASLMLGLAIMFISVWSGNGGSTAIASLGFFAWPPLCALIFLPGRQAVPYVLAAALLSVFVIAISVHSTPIGTATQTVGTIAAAAITARCLHVLLRRSSTTDPLTGLPNRQALPGILEREIARADRQHTPLTIAVTDLDGFKLVNDTEGHSAGDQLLRRVTAHWRRELRSQDAVVRYGGDEFIIVLPGCDVSAAVTAIDALRLFGTQPCSVGVAQWLPGESADATIGRADGVLYQVKRSGGNRVAAASNDSSGESQRVRPTSRLANLARFMPVGIASIDDVGVRTTIGGVQFIAGGLVPLVGLFGQGIPRTQLAFAVVEIILAILLGVGMIALARSRGDRVPTFVPHAAIVVGVSSICIGGVFLRGQTEGIAALGMLAWSWMYVFALNPWRVGVRYCVVGTTLVAVTVAFSVRQNPIGVMLLVIATTAGCGVLVGYVRLLFERQSSMDALTRLPNQGALTALLSREMAIAGRSAKSLTVSLIDLDGFKTVNDTQGHLAGDQVLKRFADSWSAELRAVDCLLRYGGDEFVLMLPGCDLNEATETLERLRALGAHPCSIGLTTWTPGDTAETVIDRADAAVYLAKKRGRNCVASLVPSDTPISEPHAA